MNGSLILAAALVGAEPVSSIKPEYPAFVFWFYIVLAVGFFSLAAVVLISHGKRVINQIAALLMFLGGIWAVAHGSIFTDADYAASYIRVSVAVSGPFVVCLWMLRGAIWGEPKSTHQLVSKSKYLWFLVVLMTAATFSPLFIPYESTWQTKLKGPLWVVIRYMPATIASIFLIAAWKDWRRLKELEGIRRFEAQILYLGGSIALLLATFRSFYRLVLSPDQTALVSGTIIAIFYAFLIYGVFSKRIFDATSVGVALAIFLSKFILSVGAYLTVSALGRHGEWHPQFLSLLAVASAIVSWTQSGRILPRLIKSKAEESCGILRKNIENSGQYYAEEDEVLSASVDAIRKWLGSESCVIFVDSIQGWRDHSETTQIPDSVVTYLQQNGWVSMAAIDRSWNKEPTKTIKPWLQRSGVEFAVRSAISSDFPDVIIGVSPHEYGKLYSHHNIKRTASVAGSVGKALHLCRLGLKGRHQGKAQAIQLIAAGLGHDLKQHTANFALFAELLETRHSEPQFRDKFLPRFKNQVKTLASYSGKMIEIGRPTGPKIQVIELGVIMHSILEKVAVHPTAQGIEIKSNFETPSPKVEIDPDLITRACLNLCVNAMQAMQRQSDSLDEPTLNVAVDSGDDSVRISIQDNGPGLPLHIRERLFEPFVRSTQPDGSGLGLYLAWDAVIQMGGTLHHDDCSPSGTRFLISWPAPRARD